VKPLLVSKDHMVRFAHHNMVRYASLPSPQSNRRAVMRGMETPL